VSGTSSGLLREEGCRPTEREVRQSRNLDCAVRREVKEVVRCSSSRSSWVFRSWSWGRGREVRSTGRRLISIFLQVGIDIRGFYFELRPAVVWTPLWGCICG
jgi:hypothetical protein